MTIYNFELLNVPFANTAVASEIAPFPDYNRGFGIAFSLTDGKPEMKGFNGLLKMVTTSVIYLKQRGISEWDSNLEYVAGKSFVVDGDKLYQAKTTNTNKQPSLSQNDWILRASISDIKVSTNGNLKRTENQDGTITLEVPTASTDQRGAVRQATSTEVANKSNVNAYVTPKNVADIAQSLGINQDWLDLTSSRSVGVDYLNDTGRTIFVSVVFFAPSLQGVAYYIILTKPNNEEVIVGLQTPVPNGYKYRLYLHGTIGINKWSELR